MHIPLAYVHFLLYLCTRIQLREPPLALKVHRGIYFREASEILAQTRCCDLQYRLFRI